MGATGSATATFGAYPGADNASVVITGQSTILTTSKVEAWLDSTIAGTSDHSPDEHMIADIDVRVESIVGGTGFTIWLHTRENANQYGAYNVSWVWV
jgi:hypothetical protein